MRYATWKMSKMENGETLVPINLPGGQFMYGENCVAGYIEDTCNMSDHSAWDLQEITQVEFEDLARRTNSKITIVDGKIVAKDMPVNIYISAIARGLTEEEAKALADN